MSESIICAIISGIITLCGVLIANSKNQAVIETKIQHLTEEVKKHNGFAQKIPELKSEIEVIKEKVSVANHRIQDLEKSIRN